MGGRGSVVNLLQVFSLGVRRNSAYGTGPFERQKNHLATIFLPLSRATLRVRLPHFAGVSLRKYDTFLMFAHLRE